MATQTFDFAAPVRNLVMEQGSSVIIDFKASRGGTPLNMTGYLLRAQVRRTFFDTAVLINLTQANGKLAFTNAANGEWLMLLAPTDTNASNGKIRFARDEEEIECVFDMEAESPTGQVFKVAKGTITIAREVTR